MKLQQKKKEEEAVTYEAKPTYEKKRKAHFPRQPTNATRKKHSKHNLTQPNDVATTTNRSYNSNLHALRILPVVIDVKNLFF